MKILILALAPLLFLQDPPATGKALAITARIEPAFSATPSVEWKTFVVSVTNLTAAEIDATLTLGYQSGQQHAMRREKFAPKVVKRLFFYIPNARDWGTIVLDIRDSAGKELLTMQQEMTWTAGMSSHRSTVIPIVALMDRAPALCPADWQVSLGVPTHLPDRKIGYDGFSAVLMRDFPLDSLLPPQRTALLDWVRSGGTLVISPGSNREWLTSRAVQDFATVAIGSSEPRKGLPELERMYKLPLDPQEYIFHRITNGKACTFHPAVIPPPPVAVEYPQGLGRVVVTAFDMERAPFAGWEGLPAFRQALLAADHSEAGAVKLSNEASVLLANANLKINALPPFGLLLVLAVLFIVCVGPVNYIVLRRMKMPLLMVLTVPAISAFFLIAVIGVGYILRGTSTVTYDICIMEMDRRSDFASTTRLFSVFSPSTRTYDITFPAGECGLPIDIGLERYSRGRVNRYADDSEAQPIVMDQSDPWTLRNAPFSQWQTRGFLSKSVQPFGGTVKFSMENGLKITNDSPHRILRGIGVTSVPIPRYYQIGEVPPNESRRFPEGNTTRIPALGPEDQLDQRILGPMLKRMVDSSFRGSLVFCILDKLPAEVGLNSSRSSSSDRVCILQLTEETP